MAVETITIKDAAGVDRLVSADQIAGAFVQVFKVAFGTDGTLTLVDGANQLPVVDSAGNTALTAILAAVDGLEGLDGTIAARLAGATPHADPAGTADVALTSVAGRLMSFSAVESTGSAAAKFYLRDGSGGTVVAIVTLAAGESIRDSFGPNGIALTTGLYLDRVSGSTEVTAAVA